MFHFYLAIRLYTLNQAEKSLSDQNSVFSKEHRDTDRDQKLSLTKIV